MIEETEEEEVSCLFLDKKELTSDEQLAVFMHRFNLDWDTVECMPAFDLHRKALIPEVTKKRMIR